MEFFGRSHFVGPRGRPEQQSYLGGFERSWAKSPDWIEGPFLILYFLTFPALDDHLVLAEVDVTILDPRTHTSGWNLARHRRPDIYL